jgi:3-hydroxybutyryl-CoA dehydrogenase
MTPETTVGVVGLGVMGLGIAQVMAQAGHAVLATDAHAPARDGAQGRVAEAMDRLVERGTLPAEARAAALGRLRVVEGPAALGAADLVVEAIAEDLGAKRGLLAALEGVLRPDAVLATNTSSLPVAALAEGLRHPERVIGLHFFNPAPQMPLVELIGHAGTAPEALALGRRLAEGAGKAVVDAPDSPGFIVNRCARPFYGEALAMLEEGRSASEVDAALLAAGYRIGPFALIDLIGADVHLAATRSVARAMGDHPRYRVFPALEAQVAAGALGRKAGRGFLHPDRPGPAPDDAAEVAARIEATLVNEAAWLLAEGRARAEAIDEAARLGLAFPRGPFAILAARGPEAVRATLAALEARTPLKGRYRPAPLLEAA